MKTNKDIIKDLSKKETSILEKYLKLKAEEKKNKENIDAIKEDVINLLESKEGKIVYKGYNFSIHHSTSFEYSDTIKNLEKSVKELKEREETLEIAKVKSVSKYAKLYELKNKGE